MSAKRVDTNQPDLVALYRHAGCRVLHLHGLGKGAPPKNRLPKPNRDGLYDFPTMAAAKAALAANPDIAKQVCVKGTRL